MKKYIKGLLVMAPGLFFSQVAIGKTDNSGNVANASVSLEFGNAEGGSKGIVLPWVSNRDAVSTVTSQRAVAGTLIYDAATKDVLFAKSNTSGNPAFATWEDLSAGALSPEASVGNPDTTPTETTSAKVIVAAATANVTGNTTNGILVLADNNKAMVLPRVNAHTDIVNPSPGMMVYITSTNQLAVFNGLQWSFWAKP